MPVGLELSSTSTLSDNLTNLEMQGASILSPEVFDQLVEVTQAAGICDRALADARQIQANFANIGDPRAQVFYGLIERILETVEVGRTAQMGHCASSERWTNQLPSMAWREDLILTPEKETQLQSCQVRADTVVSTEPTKREMMVRRPANIKKIRISEH